MDYQQQAANAFSYQSSHFDAIEENNPLVVYLRNQVRNHVADHISTNNIYLELNAGTGLDAAYFYEKHNLKIVATDISDGMVGKLNARFASPHYENSIQVKKISYENLEKLQPLKFDYVFSNFGGLNCTPNLKDVIASLKPLLNPNAHVTLVIMPRICLWELAWALKGDFRQAFRRLKSNGTNAKIDAAKFTTWYYSVSEVKRFFGKDYTLERVEAMSLFYPPPQSTKFAKNNPRLLSILEKADKIFRKLPFFKSKGDHYIATFKLKIISA
jgi:ubiquinone/menaquinone biosynthesis C-methylase UbiE